MTDIRLVREPETHSGYTNRETWALCQRLTKDLTAQDYIKERIMEIRMEVLQTLPPMDGPNVLTTIRIRTEDFLKEMLEEAYAEDLENISRDMFDLIREVGSLWRVDWREVAEEFLGD